MRKFFLFLFFLLIGSLLFFWIIKHVGWQEIQTALKAFSLKVGIVILALTILSALIRAIRWKLILKSQGHEVPTKEMIEYYLSGLTISFFAPMVIFGGEIFRGYDLKEKYFISWTKSIASVVIDRILEITVFVAIIIFGTTYFLLKIGLPPAGFCAIIFSVIFLLILLISVFYFKSFKRESIIYFFLKKLNFHNSNGGDTVIDVEQEIFHYFGPKKKAMWQGFGLSVLSGIILLARTLLLISFLGKNVGILAAISILAFSFLAIIIPIPAAIGSHEAVQSFAFSSLGLGANTGIVFAFTIRTAEFVLALIGLIFLFKTGLQLLNTAIIKKFSKIGKLIHYKNGK